MRKIIVILVVLGLLAVPMYAVVAGMASAWKSISCQKNRRALVMEAYRYKGWPTGRFNCKRISAKSRAPRGGWKVKDGQRRIFYCPYKGYAFTAAVFSRRWVKGVCYNKGYMSQGLGSTFQEPVEIVE